MVVVSHIYAEENKTTDDKSNWTYNGQAVIYYQTADNWGNGSLFDQGPGTSTEGWAKAAAGLQLKAENKDLFSGVGAGFEFSGISSLGLEGNIVSGLVQDAGGLNDAAITQAYLTYALNNTSFTWGRQELPRSLSPFAFSENWNPFKNTFEGFLVVNTDLADTVLVYANVAEHNNSTGDLTAFTDFYTAKNAANMITAQNKSIENVTLTASYYWIPDVLYVDGSYVTDADALWLEADIKLSGVSLALQGGYLGGLSLPGTDDNTAYGAKLSGKVDTFSWQVAYSSADDGTLNIANLAGEGVKSPLFTQGILNQNTIKRDSDTFKISVAMPLAGGDFSVSYYNSDLGATALSSVFGQGNSGAGTYQELDLVYTGKFDEKTKYFVGLINQNDDRQVDETQNVLRFWIRHFY